MSSKQKNKKNIYLSPNNQLVTLSKSQRRKLNKKASVNQLRLVGHGDYKTMYEKAIRAYNTLLSDPTSDTGKLSADVGRRMGAYFGRPTIGSKLGQAAAYLFGHGDYKLKTNSIVNGNFGNTPPVFTKDGRRGERVTHREMFGLLTSSTTSGAFKNEVYPITIGDSSLFPWLSQMAPLYQQWEPLGIVIEFESTSSEYNGASQSLGTVNMATDYNMNDPPYASTIEALNSEFSDSTKPSCSLPHGIECDMSERPTKVLYTDTSTQPPNFTTLGNFQISSEGVVGSNIQLGKLWITYDIVMYKKELAIASSPSYQLALTGSSIPQGNPFGDPAPVTGNNLLYDYTVLIGVGVQFTFSSLPLSGPGDSDKFFFFTLTSLLAGEFMPPVSFGSGFQLLESVECVPTDTDLPASRIFTLKVVDSANQFIKILSVNIASDETFDIAFNLLSSHALIIGA